MMRVASLLVGLALGVGAASACGTVTEVGPTAVVLEVYFNEGRGTKALLISGTAELDGVPVNVFPTSQRPEQLTGAPFPVPQTVRILLNDSRGGVPLQVTVIGLNSDGDPVEAATQTLTPLARREVSVTITLKPFTDQVDGGTSDAGIAFDAGLAFDAGSGDAGLRCVCATGCCDATGGCAAPIPIPLGSRQMLSLILSGPTGQFCTGLCYPGRANAFVNGACTCGSNPICGDGLRCTTGAGGRCVCDASSGCRGCCLNNLCDNTRVLCGNAGNSCQRCEGAANVCQLSGRCSVNTCTPPMPGSNQCCSGGGMVTAQWPTCTNTAGDCVACDTLRSNACRAVAVGQSGQPCGCGGAPQCGNTQLCLFVNGAATCTSL